MEKISSIAGPFRNGFKYSSRSVRFTAMRTFSTNEQKPLADSIGAPRVEPEPGSANPEDLKKPMTFGRFFLYTAGALSAASFSYYFYKSGFDIHKTEIAISRKLAELPLYYPPGPSQSERNTALPNVLIPQGLVDQLSAWFIYQDTALKDGVRRNDVLDLFANLGLVDPEKEGDTSFQLVGDEDFRKSLSKSVSSFVENGRGRLPEYKRQSGVSIQEAIELLNDILQKHETISPTIVETAGTKLHDILGALVESGPVRSGANVPVSEADADVRELIEMELDQLEKARGILVSRSDLSEAEQGRLQALESQIGETKNQIAKL